MRDAEVKRTLLSAWRTACAAVSPQAIFARNPGLRPRPGDAVLAWGKASGAVLEALQFQTPNTLAIIPEGALPPRIPGIAWIPGGHPLPDENSLEAGQAILRFFDELRRTRTRVLHVFLSGGASSSAWVPPFGMTLSQLRNEMDKLYRRGWDIHRANEKRATLCALKGGGAARWLRRLSPSTRIQVSVFSDVWPFGPEVVGSGPFYDGKIPHRVLAGNPEFVQALADSVLRAFHLKTGVVHPRLRSATVEGWTEVLASRAHRVGSSPILLALGGEPLIALRPHSGRGGRMTHLALSLLAKLREEILLGRVIGICASSDGVDGHSRSAGALLVPESARGLSSREIQNGLKRYDSAKALERVHSLIPERATGTNLQDAVALLVHP